MPTTDFLISAKTMNRLYAVVTFFLFFPVGCSLINNFAIDVVQQHVTPENIDIRLFTLPLSVGLTTLLWLAHRARLRRFSQHHKAQSTNTETSSKASTDPSPENIDSEQENKANEQHDP